ncbi:uncharacterized protein LOC134709712 isoform X1 [Mytilus trossulus]|uniref:uncharacterized protein LOC134709712 isoform X1 n=1 Tax=Mytilus trossulus TaxID=6551 RepID=UPI00300454E8
MAAENVQFSQIVTSTGRTEYKTQFGRGKVLTYKKSARGLLYLDLAASNGSMKLNLGLNELDDLFTLWGHLESLTAYFPQPLSQPQVQVVPKENVAPVYAPPPPPTPSAPLTIIYENETSTTTPLQTITDPMWSKGNMIPVRVAAKRPVREELHPPWSGKTRKYEQISPVKNNLYDLSDTHSMWCL